MNIFVAKLDYELTSEELQELFEDFGTVDSCKIIYDKETGRSKGFGFVEMPDEIEAKEAISALNGQDISNTGREIVVKESEPRNNNRRGGGGYGNRGGGGGYGNRGGGGYGNRGGGGYGNRGGGGGYGNRGGGGGYGNRGGGGGYGNRGGGGGYGNDKYNNDRY